MALAQTSAPPDADHAAASPPRPATLSSTDYDALHAALTATARGRAFLDEYARRNRNADTMTVLAAIDRIGATLRGEALPPQAPEYLHLGLAAMAGLIAAVDGDIAALSTGHETPEGAGSRVRRLTGTLRDLRDCIAVMLDSFNAPENSTTTKPQPAAPAAPMSAAPPPPHEPPPLTLVETTPRATPARPAPAPVATPAPAPAAAADPLAPLRALTQAELIALFS